MMTFVQPLFPSFSHRVQPRRKIIHLQDPMTIWPLALNFLLNEDSGQTNDEIRNSMCNDKCSQQKFSVELDFKDFKPEEISIKCSGNRLQVYAHHVEGDENSDYFIHREIKRTINIPEDVVIEKITSAFHDSGILTIEAPKKLENSEKTIPVLIEKELSKSENVE